MICIKSLRFSSRLRAKVRPQGPLSSARAQPWALRNDGNLLATCTHWFCGPFVGTPLPSKKLIETETKIQESILRVYMCIYHVTSLK